MSAPSESEPAKVDPIEWLNEHQFSLDCDRSLEGETIWRIFSHDGYGQVAHGKTATEAVAKAMEKWK